MSSHRLGHIDGLRGVAALFVVVSHLLEQAWVLVPSLDVPLDHPILDVLGLGRMGVVAFFCVSGYVIPFSFKTPAAHRRFLTTRFFRLYPAYWTSLFTFLVVSALAGQAAQVSLGQVAANATMVQALFRQADVVSVYWTLFYELVFYGCCMVAWQAGWLRSARSVVVIVCALSSLAVLAATLRFLRLPFAPPLGLPAYLAIMFFGTFWRHATLNGDAFAVAWRRRVLTLVLLMVGVVAVLGYWHQPLPERPLADLLGVYAGLGLFLLAFRCRRFFAEARMQWLGRISYALYLFHVACVLALVTAARQVENPSLRLMVLFLSVPVSLLVADAVARWIEMPMIRLGHALSGRIAVVAGGDPARRVPTA